MQSTQTVVFYPTQNAAYLQAAIAIQPVVIYWNMGLSWNHYSGGMFYTLFKLLKKPADEFVSHDVFWCHIMCSVLISNLCLKTSTYYYCPCVVFIISMCFLYILNEDALGIIIFK